MSESFEKDLEQTLKNKDLNQDTIKNIAVKIFVTPFPGGIDEGLQKSQAQITQCLNGKCSTKQELLNHTQTSMNYLNDWLSMLIAQNIVQKLKGKEFLDNMIEPSCPIKNRRPRRKSPRGTRY